jgi:hypothetical protein
MERAGDSTEPPPNVLLIVGMAAGLWALIYVAAASIWSWQMSPSGMAPQRESDIATQREHVLQLANTEQTSIRLPVRQRKGGNHTRRGGTSLAARVFRSTISVN